MELFYAQLIFCEGNPPISNGPFGKKSALVQEMAWRRIGARPLPEAMLTQNCDAYIYLLYQTPIN